MAPAARKKAAAPKVKNSSASNSSASRVKKTPKASAASTKSQRAARKKDVSYAENDDSAESDDSVDENSEAMDTDAHADHHQQTMLGGKKSSQLKSDARSDFDVNTSVKRSSVCLRCMGEISAFPDLECRLSRTSASQKCFDCRRKGRLCEEVSFSKNLFAGESSTNRQLTAGEVPEELEHIALELVNVAELFNEGEATQVQVNTQQTQFNQSLLHLRSRAKAELELAKERPWAPVVNAIQQMSREIQQSLHTLGNRNETNFRLALEPVVGHLEEVHKIVAGSYNDYRYVHAKDFAGSPKKPRRSAKPKERTPLPSGLDNGGLAAGTAADTAGPDTAGSTTALASTATLLADEPHFPNLVMGDKVDQGDAEMQDSGDI